MKRDVDRLGAASYDLLVIGGGIYGAWIAYDAALRGLHVALVEGDDWASGTSSGSSKMIHGGLRYLEQYRFGLVHKALAERRLLSRLGPHRVYPLRLLIPIYRSGRVGRLKLKAGLTLYDLMAGSDQPVAPHEELSRDDVVRRFNYLDHDDLVAGFTYGDCGTDDARLTLEVVVGGVSAGVAAANHCRVIELRRTDAGVEGALVRDDVSGEEVEVRAKVTVLAGGAQSPGLLQGGDTAQTPVRMTKGVHLVMPCLPSEEGLLLTAEVDGRAFFIIPWYGRTLVGTTDTDYRGDPADVRVGDEDVSYLLKAANRYVGKLGWNEESLCGAFAGLRVLRDEPGKSASSLSREWSLDHPEKGLLMPVGGKLTSARVEACTVVNRVEAILGRGKTSAQTGKTPLPWSVDDLGKWSGVMMQQASHLDMEEDVAQLALRRHGRNIEMLFQAIRENPSLAVRIVPEFSFCRAEVLHAIEYEMALTLDDILRRRMPLAILCKLPPSAVQDVADLASTRLGWSEERRESEVRGFIERYGQA